uniref:Uncharacterized protein n=1 Tax=Anguilla anguilla TaxID=7936 RepID=A0A0E9T2C0_ANGAN
MSAIESEVGEHVHVRRSVTLVTRYIQKVRGQPSVCCSFSNVQCMISFVFPHSYSQLTLWKWLLLKLHKCTLSMEKVTRTNNGFSSLISQTSGV